MVEYENKRNDAYGRWNLDDNEEDGIQNDQNLQKGWRINKLVKVEKAQNAVETDVGGSNEDDPERAEVDMEDQDEDEEQEADDDEAEDDEGGSKDNGGADDGGGADDDRGGANDDGGGANNDEGGFEDDEGGSKDGEKEEDYDKGEESDKNKDVGRGTNEFIVMLRSMFHSNSASVSVL